MTDEQKSQIKKMRSEGAGYRTIGDAVGLSANSVKSFCQRNDLGGKAEETERCKNCGARLVLVPGKKKKKFCSDKCRMLWWNGHKDQVERKANYEITCR